VADADHGSLTMGNGLLGRVWHFFQHKKCPFTKFYQSVARSGRASRSSARGRSSSSSGAQHKVTFTDKSEIHEIPPKPKRVQKDKRSKSAPGNGPESIQLRRKVYDVFDSKADSAVAVEQSQRISVTSVEELLAANGKIDFVNGESVTRGCKISDQDILDLNKVYYYFFF